MKRKRATKIEVQCLQDTQLHAQNFLLVVGLVRHENEIVNLWSVHLLEFRSDEHGSKANKLKIMSHNRRLNLERKIKYTNWKQ
jgi:hypothetical protein